MSYRKIYLPFLTAITMVLSISANAWELSQPAPLAVQQNPDGTPVLGPDGKPALELINGKKAEEELKSSYVGRWKLNPKSFPTAKEAFPADMQKPENAAQLATQIKNNKYMLDRMFSTELQLPGAVLGRYYVPDLQYDVVDSDAQGKAVVDAAGNPVKAPGLRLIPVTSGDDMFKIPVIKKDFFGPGDPTDPISLLDRYHDVFPPIFAEWNVTQANRVYEEGFFDEAMTAIVKYQTDHAEAKIYTPAEISAMKEQLSREPTVGTSTVEDYASTVAYGAPDRLAPLHIITPHTTARESFFDRIVQGKPDPGDTTRHFVLASPNAKPQTSIHHVTGFYRFDGVSKNSRRSMLSEGEPTNLRMVFSKSLNPDAQAAIKGTQFNLALWFMLYYENPEGYAFADNYEFDDSYMTNLEEVMEMGRGWLDHKYVRPEFNNSHAKRIAAKMTKLLAPFHQIMKADAKARTTKDILNTARQNVYEIRNLVTMLYGEKAATDLETAQSDVWKIQNKIAQDPHTKFLSQVLLSPDEDKKVKKLFKLLFSYETGTEAKAKAVPYYTYLQKDAALAEYCNEGVKDQTDKGLNIPLTMDWLSKIYPAKQAKAMFDYAERTLCKIQVERDSEQLSKAQQNALLETVVRAGKTFPNPAYNPCAVAEQLKQATKNNVDPTTVFVYSKLSDPKVQKTINAMTPLWALPKQVRDPERFTATNPLLPFRDANGAVVGSAADTKRDYDIRLIGNSLAYGPQTTLDIIANFSKAYVPYNKAGAANVAVVVASFLPEHNRRTGIDADTYAAVSGDILAQMFSSEARLYSMLTTPAETDTDEQKAAKQKLWDTYSQSIDAFFAPAGKFVAIVTASSAQQRAGVDEDGNPIVIQAADPAKAAAAIFAKVSNAVSDARAKPLTPTELATLGGEFGLYKKTIANIDAIIANANKLSTNPANPIDALYANQKRVKFYFQPGVNSLDHLGLVKRNPNVLIEDIGTAYDKSQLLEEALTKPDLAGGKNLQNVDQQINVDDPTKSLMHNEVIKFVSSPASKEALDKFRTGLYRNSVVGRPGPDKDPAGEDN